jgi:hypothetical protein
MIVIVGCVDGAGGLLSACVTGVIFELRKKKIARVLNIGIPTILAGLMISSVPWLPMMAKLRHSQYPGEASEGAFFVLLFAAYPLCRCLELATTLKCILRDQLR